MKKIVSFCFLGLLVLFIDLSASPGMKLRIIVPEAEIRLKPDTESLIIKKLPIGILLDAEEKIDGWYRISLPPDENGFVVKGYILESSVEIFVEESTTPPETKEPAIPKQAEKPVPKRIVPPPPPPRDRSIPIPPPPTYEPAKKSGIGLNLSLSGGMGYFLDGGGDLELTRQGRENYTTDIAALTGFATATSTFNWNKLSFSPNFNVDLFLTISPNLGIGFGSGYITASSKGDYSFSIGQENIPEWWGSYDILQNIERSRDYKITAIPLNVNLYLFLPMNSIVLSAKAGVGYYLGKMKHDDIFTYTENYEDVSWYYLNWKYIWTIEGTTIEEATCKAIGLNGSLGLDFKLSPNISFGAEVFGRLVNFKNWQGDCTYTETDTFKEWIEGFGWFPDDIIKTSESGSGTLWHYKSKIDLTNATYDYMWLEESKPSDPDYSDIREAAINLNALGIQLSLKFHFDLF